MRKRLADVLSVSVLDRGQTKCAIITIEVAGKDAAGIKNNLVKQGVNVTTTFRSAAVIDFDSKKVEEAIMLSPHYYNTFAEIDTMIEKLVDLLKD